MKAGDKLTPDNLRCIRPGMGLSPKYYEVLLGRKVCQKVKIGTPFNWNLIAKKDD